ncbi:sensor histidine kinase [Paracoccus homiensis]|uniref:sensor histidine kinase n=1 Tax=Paracoccus homiensis TaxID=364199 RepID=UPI00398C8770
MKKSLGALLALCLAGTQFLAILLVVFSSYLSSERALLQHARDLLRDVGTNTIEHSKGFLSPAEGAAQLAARLAQSRVVASDNTVLLEQLLFQQLQISPQFSGIYFGGADGSFLYVMRSPEGAGPFRTKIIRTGDERSVRYIWRDDDYKIVDELYDPDDMFDPRTRPWFIRAQETRGTIWTDPYIFFSSQQPGITLASPVIGADSEVQGVVGVDIEISMISNFLAQLRVGQHGGALILNRNGDVIAHPDPELIKTEDTDGTLRFSNISELEDPIARAAFAPLMRQGRVLVWQERPQQFILNGESYVATVLPTISDRLPWTIGVYAPEKDFTQALKENRVLNIWIAAVVAAITGLVGLALASIINKPVKAFAIRSALINQGEIDPAEPMPRTYRELEAANSALVQQIVARRATEQEYEQAFAQSPWGMAQIQPQTGALERTNAHFSKITGYSEAELRTIRFVDLIAEGETISEGFLAGDYDIAHELRCRRKDGSLIWISARAFKVRDRDGNIAHGVVMIEDISDSKVMEQEILKLNRDMSHLARGNTMGQMAAGLAHELNQPLTAISANAETALLVLEDQKQVDPELYEILQEMNQQSHRAGEIIRALRGFIRKDEGAKSAFSLRDLVEQTSKLLLAELSEANVVLHSQIPAGLPPVEANRVQIAQVIVNLVRNAIEAMSVTDPSGRQIVIDAKVSQQMMLVSVQDTGPGIPAGRELFSQFETTKADGMGLGLSLCHTIVEGNGGEIWLDRNGAAGACFRFSLPLAPTRTPPQHKEDPA